MKHCSSLRNILVILISTRTHVFYSEQLVKPSRILYSSKEIILYDQPTNNMTEALTKKSIKNFIVTILQEAQSYLNEDATNTNETI